MNQLFNELARVAGLAICLQLYGLVHTLAANYGTDENGKPWNWATLKHKQRDVLANEHKLGHPT